MKHEVPYAFTEDDHTLYLDVEITWGGEWISLQDGRFQINAQNTRETSNKSWRKVVTSSPILGGDYLVHAVPEMVTESISVWVRGQSQTDLNDNFWMLDELFSQFSYSIRWTLNEYREYWRCQLAEASSSRGQVWTHSQMALSTFQVPRYPDVTRERIG